MSKLSHIDSISSLLVHVKDMNPAPIIHGIVDEYPDSIRPAIAAVVNEIAAAHQPGTVEHCFEKALSNPDDPAGLTPPEVVHIYAETAAGMMMDQHPTLDPNALYKDFVIVAALYEVGNATVVPAAMPQSPPTYGFRGSFPAAPGCAY